MIETDADLDVLFDDDDFCHVMQWTPQGGSQQEANVMLDEPHETMLDERAVSQETRITGITSKLTGIDRDTVLTISERAGDGTLVNGRTFKAVEPPRRQNDGAVAEFLANEQ